jgi:hypothetical protein
MRKAKLWLNLVMKSGFGILNCYVKDFNTNLQGQPKLISDMFAAVRAFEMKLKKR